MCFHCPQVVLVCHCTISISATREAFSSQYFHQIHITETIWEKEYEKKKKTLILKYFIDNQMLLISFM